MLALLRNNEVINIARLAYLLARSKMSEEFTSKILIGLKMTKIKIN